MSSQERDPSYSGDDISHLIADIDSLDTAFEAETIVDNLAQHLNEQASITSEQETIAALRKKSPELADFISQYLVIDDQEVTALKATTHLCQSSPDTVSEAQDTMNVVKLLLLFSNIATAHQDENIPSEQKKILQVSILQTQLLNDEMRMALFEVADELVEGQGIDLSDPDSITEVFALIEARAEQKKQLARDALRQSSLIQAELARLELDIADPEVHSLYGIFSGALFFGASVQQASHMWRDELHHTLGITKADFIGAYQSILEKYQS